MQRFTKFSVAGLGVAALLAVGAPAFAATAGSPPTGANLPASVTVTSPAIALMMSTANLAISTTPGTTGFSGPVSYTVTASTQGYMVQVQAPDLTDGAGHTLLASDLSDAWQVSPGQAGNNLSGTVTLPEGNTPVTIYSASQSSAGGQDKPDTFSETWAAAVPGTQFAGGNPYSTVLSYVAIA